MPATLKPRPMVAEGIKIMGTLSNNLVPKIERLDPVTRRKLFIDFPLKGSPEQNFLALAKWAESLERKNLI